MRKNEKIRDQLHRPQRPKANRTPPFLINVRGRQLGLHRQQARNTGRNWKGATMIGKCDDCGHYTRLEHYPLTTSKKYFCKSCCLKLNLKTAEFTALKQVKL